MRPVYIFTAYETTLHMRPVYIFTALKQHYICRLFMLLQHMEQYLYTCRCCNSTWNITHVPVYIVTAHEILPMPLSDVTAHDILPMPMVMLLQHTEHYLCLIYVVTAYALSLLLLHMKHYPCPVEVVTAH